MAVEKYRVCASDLAEKKRKKNFSLFTFFPHSFHKFHNFANYIGRCISVIYMEFIQEIVFEIVCFKMDWQINGIVFGLELSGI